MQLGAEFADCRSRPACVEVERADCLGAVQEVDQPFGHDNHILKEVLHRHLFGLKAIGARHLQKRLQILQRGETCLEFMPDMMEETGSTKVFGCDRVDA
jgi:hypothetical protein